MTMIEQVAKAINNYLDNIGHNLENIDIGPGLAKVAIEAMREPSDAMQMAYYELNHKAATFDVSNWERSIDAALKE